MQKLKLSLFTPEKSFFKGVPVEEVLIPTELGEIGILTGHTNLISLLVPGVLKYKEKNSWKDVPVSSGYVEICENEVRVFSEPAENSSKSSK